MINIIPAIDLKAGKCVRLRQGLEDEVTEYSSDPVAIARQWENEGGTYLHVVDLDGAFRGYPVHIEVLRAIVEAIDIPVEIGGGLRTDDDIRTVLNAGVDRAILGTRACEHPEEIARLVEVFGAGRIAIGIDARDGMVQTKGWVETTEVVAADLAKEVEQAGVESIIYTDTSRDGMMRGVNVEQMAAICDAVECDIVASGGISSVDDVRDLLALRRPNLWGAIVGKALYDRTVTINDLYEAQKS